MKLPTIEDVKSAYERIKSQTHRTPVLSSRLINELAEAELYFKCENFQRAGSFKFRGASNAVMLLSEKEANRGVATHSSGNHAQALALAAKIRGIDATIVMPKNAPRVKIEAVKSYGGEIIFCEPTLQAREEALESVIADKGCTFIHPYDNFNVIAGQGTAFYEMHQLHPELDYILAPVGGGGLMSGTSIVAKSLDEGLQVVGVEPEAADDAMRSFEMGRIIPSVNPDTICDGLLTSLSDRTFAIIKQNVDFFLTADDEEIKEAMILIMQRMKLVIEPSAAVVLAVVLKRPDIFAGKRIGLILSGGNLELKNFL